MTATRRGLLAGAAAALVAGRAAAAPRSAARSAALPPVTVWKTPWCGCCGGWVTHLRRAGFTAKVVEVEDLAPVRARFGIPFERSSCHTAEVAGYGVEGHVPPEDVKRLLREKPKARALVVPGMPFGSPGMERPDGMREPYEVLLLLADGSTRVFATHK